MSTYQVQLEQIQKSNQSISIILQKTKKDFFSPSNSVRRCHTFQSAHITIIETLNQHNYSNQEIPSLIEYLADNDFMQKFYGIIGLNRLSSVLIKPANEIQIFNTGIMLKLINLLSEHQYPYLQYASLNLLWSMQRVISRENYNLYFSQITLRSEILLELLHVNKDIFYAFEYLHKRLRDRFINFNTNDNNLFFLTKIDEIMSTSQLDASLIGRIGQILKMNSTNNPSLGHSLFFKKYYEITLNLFEWIVKMDQIELKNKIIPLFSGHGYSIALEVSSFSDIPEYARYYRRIIDIYLEIGFNLKDIVFVLIGTHRFTRIISYNQLIEKIGEAIKKFVQQKEMKYNVSELFELLYTYLAKSCVMQVAEKSNVLANSINIFSSIPILYELKSKQITKQINSFICLLIRMSNRQQIYQILKKENLISIFMKYSNSISATACQTALRDLSISLHRLNKKKTQKYLQRICESLLLQDNLHVLLSIKKNSHWVFANKYCTDIITIITRFLSEQECQKFGLQSQILNRINREVIVIQDPNLIDISQENSIEEELA